MDADPRVTADIVSATTALVAAADALIAINVLSIVARTTGPNSPYLEIELSPQASLNNPSAADFQVFGVAGGVETSLNIMWVDVWTNGFGAGYGVNIDGIGLALMGNLQPYTSVRVVYTKNSSRLFQGSGKTLQSFDLTGTVI